jgi:hypothetical protein
MHTTPEKLQVHQQAFFDTPNPATPRWRYLNAMVGRLSIRKSFPSATSMSIH